jgi:hypothetical protein
MTKPKLVSAAWWIVAIWAVAVVVAVGLLVNHIPSDETWAIEEAKRAVSNHTPLGWADYVIFEAKRAGDGWIVIARRANGPTILGRPLTVFGKPLFGVVGVGPMVLIDRSGRVVHYSRGEF